MSASKRPRATSMEDRVPAITSSGKVWSRWISKPASASWHYQFVHHGIWDHDNPSPPILADVEIKGKRVPVVAQPSKQAFLYVLNRETGEPVWPIRGASGGEGHVPGEWYSPTQPFPTAPPAYENQGVDESVLIDFTPELHKEALEIVKHYKMGPIFTPPVESKAEGPWATLVASLSGSNWMGGSIDPETGVVYVGSSRGIIGMSSGALGNSFRCRLYFRASAGRAGTADRERAAAGEAALFADLGD